MTLKQLEILRALIRCSTMVAAARDLGMSQPAASDAVKAMEAQAGFALFERSNDRLFPTAKALKVHAEAETIFTLHGRLAARMRDMRAGRSGTSASFPLPRSATPSCRQPEPLRRGAPPRAGVLRRASL